MIRVNLEQMLKERGKSLYWLAQESEISYPTVHKLVNNKTSSISFDVLEKLCTLLNCSTCDIIEHTKED